LKGIRRAFDLFEQDGTVDFVTAAGIREMDLVTMVGKDHQDQDKGRAEGNHCDSRTAAHGPALFLTR
jgi:hypothetical protein